MKHVSGTELVISADRSPDHEKGPKHIVVVVNGAMIPSGVILGKLTHLTIKRRNFYNDGTEEIVDWPQKGGDKS